MADIRCPMCGKLNSDDREACQYCQARLKPMRISPSEPAPVQPAPTPSEPQTGDSEQSLPDWLQDARQPDASGAAVSGESDWLGDMRSGFMDEAEPEAETSAPSATEDDWLSRTGLQQGPGPASDIPDWLSQPAAPATPAPQAKGAQLPDWLSAGSSSEPGWQEEAEPQASSPDSEPEEIAEAELPDWLISGEQANLPDWLPPSQPQTPPAPSVSIAAEPQETDLADWLSKLDSAAGDTATAGAAAAASGLPDWLSGSADTPASQEASGLPDWMASEEKPSAEASGKAPDLFAASEQAEESLDWLNISEAAPSSQPAEESLDWLSRLDAGLSETPSPEAAPTSQPAEENLDWLSELDTGSTGAPASEALPPAQPAEEGLDWLNGLSIDFSETPAQPAGQPSQPTEEDLSWLSSFDASSAASPTPAAAPSPESAAEDLSWLSDLGASLQEIPAETAAAPLAAEESPGWLNELGASLPEMPGEATGLESAASRETTSPFDLGEAESQGFDTLGDVLPGWLAGAAQEGTAQLQALAGEESGADLTPANLPSWLEAMRPVEAVGVPVTGIDEGEARTVEGAGPLTGIKGVLPAEPDISYARKPPVYSVKLHVSDLQQVQADLLEQLVKSESEPAPIPGPAVITSQRILRIGIFVILLLALLGPLITGGMQIAPPMTAAEESTTATSQLVADLNAQAPVLLAIDYEPGLSGEMDAATAAVVNHLMERGAFLTLVSTSPTGPLQAERLLMQINERRKKAEQPLYTSPANYTNLGYIPGGAIGLLAFVQDPYGIVPWTLEGEESQKLLPLKGVASVTNFGMVVVATEKPDTARAWIEQVQPKLGGVPLIMVTSAQAEPIIRPYYVASPKQIQGLVSGLAGGATYEYSTGATGTARGYWGTFSIGMLVAALLIALGGGFNIITTLLARAKEAVKREA